jgi:dipeptidyl aminopeptidase/acylaminoacyl peptidase
MPMPADRLRAVIAVLAIALALPAGAAPPPLLPREVLFGNPVKASPKISPDSTRLAYLAPSPKGVLNLWLKTLGRNDDAQVSNDTHRGIRMYEWAEDGAHLLYLQDIGGDENFHVYSIGLASKVVRDLTPFQGIRAEGLMTDRKHPGEILVGLNLRHREVFDMHRINLATGAVALDTENPGDVMGWVTDADFQVRGAMAMNSKDASNIMRVRETAKSPFKDVVVWPFGENGSLISFAKDGKQAAVITSLGTDTARLALVSTKDGKEAKVLAKNDTSDVEEVVVHPETKVVQAVATNYLRREWQVLDPSIKDDFASLAKLAPGDFEITSRDRADRSWVVRYERDDGPVAWYLYHREKKAGELLFVNQPALEKFQLAKMEPVVIPARDGLKLVSYLTLPVWRKAEKLPLVLDVHGGPWHRDSWGYDPEAQWFANRGYATLQVNFRASTGFGKKHLNAGNLQWSGTMQDDLTDAVKWAIDGGYADPAKVCIFGGSYGGYATLAGLTVTPELFKCGVDIVGPSNIKTLLASIPPYWAPVMRKFHLRVGDVAKDEELNKKISPLFHVERVRAALLIAQGQNDPRVNIRESDQMVQAIRARKLPVDYVVYPDEGHGFARPENRLDFYGRVDEFLGKQLGGRVEPWKKVEGSTAEAR